MAKIIGNLVGTTMPQPKIDIVLDINSNNAIANKVVAEFKKDTEERIEELETTITEHHDTETCIQVIHNNTIHVISTKVGITFGNTEIGFTAAMHFSTPSAIPTDYSDFPDEVVFKGDSVTDDKIVPEANTRYSIVFYCDGVKLYGYVSGVSI